MLFPDHSAPSSTRRPWRSRCGLVVLVFLSCVLPSFAAGKRSETDASAIQMAADVILIDRQCRQWSVDFGALFRYTEAHGLRAVDIMPFGSKRALLAAAMKKRAQTSPDDALCGNLAEQRAEAIPGAVVRR